MIYVSICVNVGKVYDKTLGVEMWPCGVVGAVMVTAIVLKSQMQKKIARKEHTNRVFLVCFNGSERCDCFSFHRSDARKLHWSNQANERYVFSYLVIHLYKVTKCIYKSFRIVLLSRSIK